MKFFKFCIILTLLINYKIYSQVTQQIKTPDNKEFRMVYIQALQGDCKKAIETAEGFADSTLSEEQITLKKKFISRFKSNDDTYIYNTKNAAILNLIEIYKPYWRSILLKEMDTESAENVLRTNVTEYLYTNHFAKENIEKQKVYDDFTDYVQTFLKAHGCNAATGKTAGLYDLLLWQSENHKEYSTKLPETDVTVNIVFMNDVVTMGWEDYATLGKYYPGGWATDKELFCVGSAYDTTSENFKVSYLQHEGQHFADYKVFPKLSGCDLEYRAKLVELTYADVSLYNLISFFIKNSNYDKNNPHSYAAFCMMRDMSKKIFNENETITDNERWKEIPKEKINAAAKELLFEHTKNLHSAGAETVTEYIK